jgi:hypothetical protein
VVLCSFVTCTNDLLNAVLILATPDENDEEMGMLEASVKQVCIISEQVSLVLDVHQLLIGDGRSLFLSRTCMQKILF